LAGSREKGLWSGFGLEALDEVEEAFGDGAGFGDGVGDGDVGDFGAFEDYEAAEFLLVD
jgi:hypothetical protein